MSTMSYAAIPTIYKGVQFRSRLEARYAVWFDMCRVPWLYEPIDLYGYIPDFIIGEGALVEIKPALNHSDLDPAIDKIIVSGWMNAETPIAYATGASPTVSIATFKSLPSETIARARHAQSIWVTPYSLDMDMVERATEEFWLGVSDTMDDLWRRSGNVIQWRRDGARASNQNP